MVEVARGAHRLAVVAGAAGAAVVLLDLDDTLVYEQRTVPGILAAAARLAERRHGVSAAELAAALRGCARRRWRALPVHPFALAVGISSWEGMWATFEGNHPRFAALWAVRDEYQTGAWSDALGLMGVRDAALAAALVAELRGAADRRFELVPDARRVVLELARRMRVGIVTNGVPELQRRKLAALRVDAAVEHVVVSGALGYGKPDPRIFQHALRLFRAPARACLMVGNSLEHDVAGARAAALRTVWFAHEEVPGTPAAAAARVPPDHVIGSLAELLTLPAVRSGRNRSGTPETGKEFPT